MLMGVLRLWCSRRSRTRQSYCPRLEHLESRWALAGNVAATFVEPGFLLVTGDDLDNHIHIKGGKTAGEVTVHGIQRTSVDGAHKRHFSGIERIRVELGGGDDSAKIFNLTMSSVNASGPQALAGIFVRAGSGNDDVDIHNVSLFADGQGMADESQAVIIAEGSDGDDDIRIWNAQVEATGADHTFAQIYVLGDISGSGNDRATVMNASIRAYGGSISNTALLDVQELLGGGNDVYTVMNSSVVASGPLASSRIRLDLGDGDDSAIVKNSRFDHLEVRLGSGDDEMELRNNDIAILAFLDGGEGDDTLKAKNNSGTVSAIGFED